MTATTTLDLAEYTAITTAACSMPLQEKSPSSSSSSLPWPPPPPPRRVHFGGVTTRYYQRILGDHPLCSDGLPLTFGWTFFNDQEEQENDGIVQSDGTMHQFGCNATTGSAKQKQQKRTRVPRLTLVARMSILLESGLVSEEEIVKQIHRFHRNKRRACHQQRRAKFWMGILNKTERTLESFRFCCYHHSSSPNRCTV